MAQVRIPTLAKKILPFCRPWQIKQANACFATYADLMMFAAGLGYQKMDGQQPPPQCQEFLEGQQPYPIEFSVFKNPGQQLYPLVLLLGLAASNTHDVVKDEERLARIVENYATIGFQKLDSMLDQTGAEGFHVELLKCLMKTQ